MILLVAARRSGLRKTEATAEPTYDKDKRKQDWHQAPHLIRRYHGSSDTVRDIPVTNRRCRFPAVGADRARRLNVARFLASSLR